MPVRVRAQSELILLKESSRVMAIVIKSGKEMIFQERV